jgi:hypothetical protein
MMTKAERKASRKRTLRKYCISEKNKIVQKRYRKKHRKQLSKIALIWVNKNRKRVRELERKRNATSKGKAIRRAIQVRYNAKNRIKRLAKDTVHNAIMAGKLNKMPCAICGITKTEGHHPDYKKPLEVVWLCKKHHIEVHK